MENINIKNKTHTLIISDLHLGSRVSRAKETIEFLKNLEFKKLILLGDIFEDLNFNRLRSDDEISKARKIMQEESYDGL